jgi:PAS domain S-box-containing protein
MMKITSSQDLNRGELVVVEDNPADLRYLSEMLSEAGYSVRHAIDGKLALGSIRAKMPDMVLLDVNVPGMNGVELCRQIRSDKKTRDLPVIFISALSEAELKVTALEAGGTDFISKPFYAPEVLARIRTHLRFYKVKKELANRTVALSREIEEHKRVQQQLTESYEYINNSPAVSFLWQNTEHWPVEYVSDNVSEVFGYTAEEFSTGEVQYFNLIHPDDIERVVGEVMSHAQLENQPDMLHEPYRITTKEGNIRWIKDRTRLVRGSDGEVTHYQGVVLDITEGMEASAERKKLQIIQNEKMASIGQLAAGVAHEINNPIGYILSNLNTMDEYLGELREYIDADDPQSLEDRKDILEIVTDFGDAISESLEGANRVKCIVADMKGFSRADSDEKSMTDINEGLAATLNIVWNQLKYHCEVIKDYGDLPEIACFSNRINQVFLNLLVNAGQAIGDNQGVITVKTWADDDNVHIMIRDTGCGISKESQTQLFNAFYTTKDVGVGTGLGLNLSHDIVSKHGGSIAVDSVVGEWTEFVVTLPVGCVTEKDLVPQGPPQLQC